MTIKYKYNDENILEFQFYSQIRESWVKEIVIIFDLNELVYDGIFTLTYNSPQWLV